MKKAKPTKPKQPRTPKRKSPPKAKKPAGQQATGNSQPATPKRGPGRPRKHPRPTALEEFIDRFPKKSDAHAAAKLAHSPTEPYRPVVNEICIAHGEPARVGAIGGTCDVIYLSRIDAEGKDIPGTQFAVMREEIATELKPLPPQRDPLPIHPLSERLPMMTDVEYKTLKASIRDFGQLEPVVLLDGRVLDGRNRDKACCELGVETRTIDFSDAWGTPVDYVIAKASHRNMTEGQRACAAEAFMDDLASKRPLGRPKRESSANPARLSGKSSEIAGMRFGVAARYVEEVRAIKRADKALYQEVFSGRINVNQAVNRLKQSTAAKAAHSLQDVPVSFKPSDLRLIHGDNVDVCHDLKKAGDKFTVIFTDPPYNIGYPYDADPHADQLPHEKFLHCLRRSLKAASDLLTDDGSIYVLIDDANSDHVGLILRDLGLHRRGCIVWWESFAQHNPGDFTCCTRYVHYYTKHPTDYVWTPPMVPSARLEVYKDARANPRGKVPDNVWTVSRKQGTANDRVPFADAPPQIPCEIPARCILTSSKTGDAVLDCYNGNGTTGLAALMHGRRYTGIDRSKLYLDQSRKFITGQLKATSNVGESKS